jgi:hypothetical protein
MDSLPKGKRYGGAYVIPAFKDPRPKYIVQAERIFTPMSENWSQLQPRPGMAVAEFDRRLRAYPNMSEGFITAQVAADTKRVEPLLSAPDFQTFAVSGPGSRVGLNFLLGRPAETTWRKNDRDWYQRHAELHALITPLYQERGLPIPDFQDLQNQLCEFHKYWSIKTGLKTKLKREYKPIVTAEEKAKEPPKRISKRKSLKAITATLAASEAVTVTAPPTVPASETIPDYITQDETSSVTVLPFPTQETGQAKASSSVPPGGSTGHEDEDDGDSDYTQEPNGKPFSDGDLIRRGYAFVRAFNYTLPDRTLICEQRRYELRPGILEMKGRPRKTFRPRYPVNGNWMMGPGSRRIPYNWPALMRTGPGATVFIPEGEGKVDDLDAKELLATTVVSHKWTAESIAALTGRHLIILADHDKKGEEYAADARAKLMPVAASVRVVPYLHLWEHLPAETRGKAPAAGEDISDWLKQGGDPAKLLWICQKIPASGTVDFTDVVLTAQDWLARDLAEPDLLMGHLLSTTVRALLNATTGIGKTNFSMALFGHIGAGKDFLHWRCPRPRQVLYIDGEMSRKLFRDRIADVVRRLGAAPVATYFFNKADVENFAPLNTPEGQAAIWQLIAEIERRSGQPLDAVCFDSIMALLLGDMKEEDAWRNTMPLVHALTKRQIGQLWIHHTGHDTSRGYGTKTREWQLDTVMHLDEIKRPDTDVSFSLIFPKARERTPDNRGDFTDVDIALVNDQWTGIVATNVKAKITEPLTLKFFELCSTPQTPAVSRQPTDNRLRRSKSGVCSVSAKVCSTSNATCGRRSPSTSSS